MEPLIEFNPEEIQCAVCKDIIKSSFEGEYVSCSCGAIAVDQAKHYTRYLGDPKNFIRKGGLSVS